MPAIRAISILSGHLAGADPGSKRNRRSVVWPYFSIFRVRASDETFMFSVMTRETTAGASTPSGERYCSGERQFVRTDDRRSLYRDHESVLQSMSVTPNGCF